MITPLSKTNKSNKELHINFPLNLTRLTRFHLKPVNRIIYCIIFCFSVLTLEAQQSLVLSLDSAISYGINHNKTLINSKYNVDKSTQKIKEAISQGLPQLNASLDYSNYLGAEASLQLNPSGAAAVIEFNPTSNFKANVSQLLFNGSYFVGVQISKLAQSLSAQGYQKDELDVKEQIIQAYYLVLASERTLNIIKENKTNAQLIYEKTRNMADAGVVEQTDAKKLSVMATSVDNALKSAERQLEMSYNLLRLQLGIESDRAITLTTTLDDIVQRNSLKSFAPETFNFQNNLDYKLVSVQSEIAGKNIELKKTSYLPSVAAFYSYTEKLKKPVFDISPKNVLGLTVSIPIFSSGQRSSQLNQAKIDFNISENTKALLVQQLTLQERQLRYNYNNLLEQYFNQKANVEIAKEVLNKMDLKYQQGIVSSLEFTSSNNDYLTAESNFTNVMLQLLNAETSLLKITNKL